MPGPFDRRQGGRRHRWAAVVVVAGLTVGGVACSGDDGPAPQSALVESMWTQDDPVVSADSPDPLVLPGPDLPDDVVLVDVARPASPAPGSPDPLDPSGAAQTLYADPDASRPEAGPMLVVGRTQATDTGGTLVLVEDDTGGGDPGGEAVDVGHPDATRVEVDGLVVVRWPLPVDYACCHQGFVAGRGVDIDEVMAAARAADVEAPRPSVPEEERSGLASLGTVAAEVRYFPGWSAYPERLRVSHDGGQAELRVHRGDPRMLAHVRFWSPDGDVPSPFPTLHRVTILDDGTIVHATATTDDVAAVESIVDEAMASLVPATDAEIDAAPPRPEGP